MIRLIVVCSFALLACLKALGQGCELQVRIENQTGESTEAWIVVRADVTGREQRVRTQNGSGKICDVGYSRFSMEVYEAINCPRIVIHNLKHTFGRELNLRVVVPACIDEPLVPPSGCLVLLRARTPEGASPERVEFHNVPGRHPPIFGDKLGRVFFTMDYGDTVRIEANAENGKNGRITITCQRNAPEVEHTIILKRQN